MTMQEMCEFIERAKIVRKKDGSLMSAEEIFLASPNGELSHVFEWYELAKLIVDPPRRYKSPFWLLTSGSVIVPNHPSGHWFLVIIIVLMFFHSFFQAESYFRLIGAAYQKVHKGID